MAIVHPLYIIVLVPYEVIPVGLVLGFVESVSVAFTALFQELVMLALVLALIAQQCWLSVRN